VTPLEKYQDERKRISEALKMAGVVETLYNKDNIPKKLPCAILILDSETGKLLTVAEIAYLIRGKIKREGIAARNVFAEVIANREQWIYQQLNSIEVSL